MSDCDTSSLVDSNAESQDERIFPPQISGESESHSIELLQSLLCFKINGSFCDVTITAGDLKIKAHRNVLASASIYFEKMLLHENKESASAVINFPKTPPEIVRKCIDFIYTGKVGMSTKTVRELLHAAEMMVLHGLSELCVKFITERIDMKSCAEVLNLAHVYQKESLDLVVSNFLGDNLENFVKSNDFKALDGNSAAYCLGLVQEGSENVEIIKWNALMSWINNDLEERKEFLPKLFAAIDLSSLSQSFVKENILSEPLIDNSIECLRNVSKFCFGYDDGVQRKTRQKLEKISMFAGDLLVQYDLKTEEWRTPISLPKAIRGSIDLMSYKGDVYIGTGTKIYRYRENCWTSKSFKQDSKCGNENYCRSCGKIMICENLSYHQEFKLVGHRHTIFHVSEDVVIRWNTITSDVSVHNVNIQVHLGFFVAASDKKIYILCGESTFEFDLSTNKTSHLNGMIKRRNNGHAFWFNGKLFAFGGDFPSTVECYHPDMDLWCMIENLEIPRNPCNLFIGDKLYLLGGDVEGYYETVELELLKSEKNWRKCNLKVMKFFGLGL